MSEELDPRIRRVAAEMMREVLGASYVSAHIHVDTAHACRILNEIATAPAAASGDAASHKDASNPVGVTGASPSDPFAPMIEAAMKGWSPRYGTELYETRMRCAIAAALRTAPITPAMFDASESSYKSPAAQWRVMANALADEIDGGKR